MKQVKKKRNLDARIRGYEDLMRMRIVANKKGYRKLGSMSGRK